MPRRRIAVPESLPETIIATPEEFAGCVHELASHNLLGLDTEFVGEETYTPELCLIQVATTAGLYLIDPKRCGPIDPFWNLLLDRERTVVVHAGREEIRMCWRGVDRPPARIFDVQLAAGLVGFTYPLGYGGLVQELTGKKMTKGETLTDWRQRPLTPSQLRYAYDDVRYLLSIHGWLSSRLQKLKRTDWADEEFERFVNRAIENQPDVERWRKLKGLGGLSRRELAIARSLYTWRDQNAAMQDRPPRTVLRDDLLIEIARRKPRDAEAIGRLRGVPRSASDTFLEVVNSAMTVEIDECPIVMGREQDTQNLSILATLLNIALVEHCNQRKLASNLVATMQDLKNLIRTRLNGNMILESGLMTGWRNQEIEPFLRSILDGERVIRVVNPKSMNPIQIEEHAGETDPPPNTDLL